MAICTVLVLSILIDRSPLWMISGLGALSAVLLLVFRTRCCRWWPAPSSPATTCCASATGSRCRSPTPTASSRTSPCTRSRCRTGTTPSPRCRPTLFSESYRNYRHMFESGGRQAHAAHRCRQRAFPDRRGSRAPDAFPAAARLPAGQDQRHRPGQPAHGRAGRRAGQPPPPDQYRHLPRVCAGLPEAESRGAPGHGHDGAHDGAAVRRHPGRGLLLHRRHRLWNTSASRATSSTPGHPARAGHAPVPAAVRRRHRRDGRPPARERDAGNGPRRRRAAGAGIATSPGASPGRRMRDLLLRRCSSRPSGMCWTACGRIWPGWRLVRCVGHVQRARAACTTPPRCCARARAGTTKRELPNYSCSMSSAFWLTAKRWCSTSWACASASTSARTSGSDRAPRAAARAGAQVLVPNASPYNTGKQEERLEVARRCARENRLRAHLPTWWAARTSWCSMARPLDAAGEPAARLARFHRGRNSSRSTPRAASSRLRRGRRGAVLPGRAGLERAGAGRARLPGQEPFPRRIIGRLAASIRPWCWPWWTPSAPTIARRHDAHALYRRHFPDRRRRHGAAAGRATDIAIGPAVDAFEGLLGAVRRPAGGRHRKNIQARVRGTLLMALSNKDRPPATTGNKSEMTTGYCRRCGAWPAAFAVIRTCPDPGLPPGRLAHRDGEVIPEHHHPAARPSCVPTTDQDSLPPRCWTASWNAMEQQRICRRDRRRRLSARGGGAGRALSAEAVEQVVRLIRINEYKRRQAPHHAAARVRPGLALSCQTDSAKPSANRPRRPAAPGLPRKIEKPGQAK